MTVNHQFPTTDGTELVGLVREIAQTELALRAARDEAAERFPRELITLLGDSGLLGLPYPEDYRGLSRCTRYTCRRWRRSPPPG